jgi:hypothetical protein
MQPDRRVRPSLSLSAALLEATRAMGAKRGLTLSATVDAALREWIVAEGKRPPTPLVPRKSGPKPTQQDGRTT